MTINSTKIAVLVFCWMDLSFGFSIFPEPTFSPQTNLVELNYFHIYSYIRYRYARTRLLMQIQNHAATPTKTSFYVKIPKDEFVTEFTMERDRAEFKSLSQIVDDIQSQVNSSASWLGVAEMIPNTGDSRYDKPDDTYKLTLNLNGRQTLSVTFAYEGFVHRISGNHIWLQYELNMKPERPIPIKSYKVSVNITESRLARPWLSNLRGKVNPSKTFVLDQESFQQEPNTWVVTWSPDDNTTKELITEDIFGQVKLMYNILPPSDNTSTNANNVVIVRDGYLTYDNDRLLGMRDSMENMDTEILPRHVVFVLDTSVSMAGRRLTQLKLGMTKILDRMDSTTTLNFVDIVTFSNKVTIWSPLVTLDHPHPIRWFKMSALKYIQSLEASGSTNFLAGLTSGLGLANRAQNFNLGVPSILIFVTDGEPTSGRITTEAIVDSLLALNPNGSVPIYSIAFGADADFALCRQISSTSKYGLARKIFDLDDLSGSDSETAQSFETFYSQITSPVIQNVSFEYTTPVDYVSEMTHQQLISVLINNTTKQFSAIKFDATTYEIPCAEHCLMERLFAIRRIKTLFRLSGNETLVEGYCSKALDLRRRSRPLGTNIRAAIRIALKHNFITPCTSLLIKS